MKPAAAVECVFIVFLGEEALKNPNASHHCEICDDDGTLYMSPRCHPGKPVFCLLTGNVLTLECSRCRKIVCRLRVMPDPLTEEEAQSKP